VQLSLLWDINIRKLFFTQTLKYQNTLVYVNSVNSREGILVFLLGNEQKRLGKEENSKHNTDIGFVALDCFKTIAFLTS